MRSLSDGYHTFDELYDHRITLYVALCKAQEQLNEQLGGSSKICWRSKLHHDGSAYEGWFILGMGTEPGEQISYHLPVSRWEETNFAETLERAPEFDGHTSQDVLNRLKQL